MLVYMADPMIALLPVKLSETYTSTEMIIANIMYKSYILYVYLILENLSSIHKRHIK